MTDPRIDDYAKLLVEECLDVQPGWQVMVSGGVLARPLIEEVFRLLGRKGGYAISPPKLAGQGLHPRLGPGGADGAAGQPGADRDAPLPRGRRLDRDRSSREHT